MTPEYLGCKLSDWSASDLENVRSAAARSTGDGLGNVRNPCLP